MSDWDDDYCDDLDGDEFADGDDEFIVSGGTAGQVVLIYCLECTREQLAIPGEPFECDSCGWTEGEILG